MSWLVVARREALDARRSRALWTVVGLFGAVGVAAVAVPAVAIGDGLSAEEALAFLVAPLRLVVGLTALLAGYGAVAGPRTGGQFKLVLGLPIRRTALVVGSFVGRTAVVLTGVLVGLAAVAVALYAAYGTLPAAPFVGFAALLGLFAVAITALAVGISAASPTRGHAAVAAIGAFVAFEFFWGVVPGTAHYLVEGSLPGAVVPPWVVLLERLQPFAAFEAATDLALPRADQAVQLSAGGAEAADGGTRPLEDRLAAPAPAYLDPWAGVVTLAGWAVVSLLAGMRRFDRIDL